MGFYFLSFGVFLSGSMISRLVTSSSTFSLVVVLQIYLIFARFFRLSVVLWIFWIVTYENPS